MNLHHIAQHLWYRVERPGQHLLSRWCTNRTLQFIFISYQRDSGCLEKSQKKKKKKGVGEIPQPLLWPHLIVNTPPFFNVYITYMFAEK